MGIFSSSGVYPNKKKLVATIGFGLLAVGIVWYNHTSALRASPSIFPLITHGDTAKLEAAVSSDRSVLRQVDLDGNTALHVAAVVGNAEIVQAILSQGGNPNALNERGETPLLSAISAPRNGGAVVKALLGAGADTKAKLPRYASILHAAARIRSVDPQAVALLAKDTALLSLKDESGKTALDVAREVDNARFISAVSQLARN